MATKKDKQEKSIEVNLWESANNLRGSVEPCFNIRKAFTKQFVNAFSYVNNYSFFYLPYLCFAEGTKITLSSGSDISGSNGYIGLTTRL